LKEENWGTEGHCDWQKKRVLLKVIGEFLLPVFAGLRKFIAKSQFAHWVDEREVGLNKKKGSTTIKKGKGVGGELWLSETADRSRVPKGSNAERRFDCEEV